MSAQEATIAILTSVHFLSPALSALSATRLQIHQIKHARSAQLEAFAMKPLWLTLTNSSARLGLIALLEEIQSLFSARWVRTGL